MVKSFIQSGFKDILDEKRRYFLHTLMMRQIRRNLNDGFPRLMIFSFDSVSSAVNIYGVYERADLELAIKWLKDNNLVKGAVLDVGANIGNHSIFFSKHFEKVFSFEPNPLTYKLLSLNAEVLSTNVKAYQYGVSDMDGMVPFHTPNKFNISSSRVVQNQALASGDDVIQVPLVKLDTFDEIKNEKIGLIKIDVEGLEIKVLSGAKNLIEKERPVILFEQHEQDFVNGKSESIEFLRGLGYKFLVIKYSPKRSGKFSKLNKLFNFTTSLLTGSKRFLIEPQTIEPDSYPFIIAYYPA